MSRYHHKSIDLVRSPDFSFKFEVPNFDGGQRVNLHKRAEIVRESIEVPLAPENKAEALERLALVYEMVPSLKGQLPTYYIGWMGIFELVAHALDARGLGKSHKPVQIKEKFGSLRWYTVTDSREEFDIIEWGTSLSDVVCSRYGTMDGSIVSPNGWYLVLGERAQKEIAEAKTDKWQKDFYARFGDL